MILADTGPIVALFDRDDRYHALCLQTIAKLHASLVTTWPVLTECFYLLGFSWEAQNDLWTFLKRGGLELFLMDKTHFSHCWDLIAKILIRHDDEVEVFLLGECEKFPVAQTTPRLLRGRMNLIPHQRGSNLYWHAFVQQYLHAAASSCSMRR